MSKQAYTLHIIYMHTMHIFKLVTYCLEAAALKPLLSEPIEAIRTPGHKSPKINNTCTSTVCTEFFDT